MLDYKSIFDKFIERLFELDTTETKLDISYYSHYPKPKQIQYEKAHSYLLNEFKRIETKELYDFEYSFNMIQDELSDFILLIHEYNRALEQGGAEFDFYIDFWNNENIKILEESISLFKKKINSTQPMKKSIENDQINSNKDLSFYLILLIAYTANQKQKISFKSFFKREAQIENRNNYVEFQDFFDGCQYALNTYKNEIIRQYNKRLTENDWVVSSVKSGNGIKFGDEIVTDQSDKRIQDSLHRISEDVEYVKSLGYVNNIDFICYLTDMGEITTNIWEKNFEQKLYWQDIVQIEQGVYQAKEELVFDNSISTNPIPLQVNPRSVPSDNLSIDSQAMPNKNDYDIDMHAYNLGHCISTATRWDMKAIKNTTTKATPYSVFGTYFEKQREYFDNFKKALRLEFDNPINGKGFEIDIKNKFYPMIKRYYDWYDKHKAETVIFEPYNFYEWIFEWTKDTENEIKKYFETELPKANSIDIIAKIEEYQLFSNDLNERTEAIFKSNEDKTQKLDIYFKDIFPEYIQSTNNILTLLEEMEKSFKSSLPALTEEYNKLVLINAGFKKQIIESVEKLFTKILEIDNNRIFYEYFEAINFLETRLELENKQIASFFKTLEKRIKHISDNSKLNKSTKQPFDNSALTNFQPQTINITSVKTFATYLNIGNKETLIEKIRQLDKSTPKKIFIILKALYDNGVLLSSDNNTIYEAYYNEFGYSKSFDTLTRGLNYYDFQHVDKKLIQSIENMQNNLSI